MRRNLGQSVEERFGVETRAFNPTASLSLSSVAFNPRILVSILFPVGYDSERDSVTLT